MKNTNEMNLAPEVSEALTQYNSAIDGALAAVQKLEAIYVTEHLAKMFGVEEEKTAKTLEQDYLQAA